MIEIKIHKIYSFRWGNINGEKVTYYLDCDITRYGTFKIPLENSVNKDILRIFFRAIGTSNTTGEADINICSMQ